LYANHYKAFSRRKHISDEIFRLDRLKLFQGLQVKPHGKFGYRPFVGKYEVLEDTRVVTGKAFANKELGIGGLTQYVIETYPDVLKLVGRIFLGE
jgi:hypothetical protein